MHSDDPITLAQLREASTDELEALYTAPGPRIVPAGRFHGEALHRCDSAAGRSLLWRAVGKLAFGWMPFGVDFERRLWYFLHRRVALGRFELRPGPSRWRPAERIIQLHYEPSRLPGLIRRQLYDEVKPLSEELCLGIGGLNAERGQGDHFFFALRRR